MARNMNIEQDIIAPLVNEFAVPEAADVSWTGVTRPAAQGDERGVLEAFYAPESGAEDDAASLEISVADLSTNAEWPEFAESGLESVDLNDLLDAGSVSAELEAIAILGENAAEEPSGAEANADTSQEQDGPDLAHLSQDLLFPQVTIVIDADAETDSVAF